MKNDNFEFVSIVRTDTGKPLTQWDYLGLLTASGGVPHRNVIEHESYLRFMVTCPSCSEFVWEYVDYSGAVAALETLDGKKYIDNLAGPIPPAAGLGGLDDIQNVNCAGKPTTVDVYMKTRLAGRGWPTVWGNGSGAAAANAYAAGTVIHYHCLPCAAPSTPNPNNPVVFPPTIPPLNPGVPE